MYYIIYKYDIWIYKYINKNKMESTNIYWPRSSWSIVVSIYFFEFWSFEPGFLIGTLRPPMRPCKFLGCNVPQVEYKRKKILPIDKIILTLSIFHQLNIPLHYLVMSDSDQLISFIYTRAQCWIWVGQK